VTTHLLHLVDSVVSGGHVSLLADYLDERQHPEAPVIRHLTDPTEVVRLLLGKGLTILDTLSLPLPSRAKLELVLHRQLYSNAVYSQLACDFAERVLPRFEKWNAHDGRPRYAIEFSRRWQSGGVSDVELYDACHATMCSARDAQRAGHAAAGYAANAAGAASDDGGDALDASYYAQLSGGEAELDWQTERIRRVLQEQAR
jgi:hypothetical protein